jgi:hypothetical protein
LKDQRQDYLRRHLLIPGINKLHGASRALLLEESTAFRHVALLPASRLTDQSNVPFTDNKNGKLKLDVD